MIVVAAQQLDGQLIEHEQLLGLLGIAHRGQAEDAGIGDLDGSVADDGFGVGFDLGLGSGWGIRRIGGIRIRRCRCGCCGRRRAWRARRAFASLTKVPLRLLQSSIHQRPSRNVTSACTREQSGSASTIWQSSPRPMRLGRSRSKRKCSPARLPTVMVKKAYLGVAATVTGMRRIGRADRMKSCCRGSSDTQQCAMKAARLQSRAALHFFIIPSRTAGRDCIHEQFSEGQSEPAGIAAGWARDARCQQGRGNFAKWRSAWRNWRRNF